MKKERPCLTFFFFFFGQARVVCELWKERTRRGDVKGREDRDKAPRKGRMLTADQS